MQLYDKRKLLIRNNCILSLASIASSFRVTEENLVFETVQSGPYSSLNVFSALKGTHFYILFQWTARLYEGCSEITKTFLITLQCLVVGYLLINIIAMCFRIFLPSIRRVWFMSGDSAQSYRLSKNNTCITRGMPKASTASMKSLSMLTDELRV